MRLCLVLCLVTFAALPVAMGEESKAPAPKETDAKGQAEKAEIPPQLKAALEKLDLPNVKINIEEWSADVDAKVCDDYGLLEVVACLKGTRDHESVVSTEAKPSHIHTALLLLGGVPGSPAMQQMLQEDPPRFRSILPSGSPVKVSLVIKDEQGVAKERPVSDFIIRAKDEYEEAVNPGTEKGKKVEHFPTDTFLFAGSVLLPAEGDTPRRYLADTEGNIVSISTFGDEVLCLPDIRDKSNDSLIWQADRELLKPGNVIMRLRPLKPAAGKKPQE